ncbi:MAG: competence/damage-inducible protein A [Verrucomicrobia bacterium]|nr:competence/damage-inducible protein A [Verrucomicrobiota bacterium]
MTAFATAELINTGTELLFGSVINTHLAFLGQQLFSLGVRISRQTTVPDSHSIRDAILEAAGRCPLLLVTGGLGPTTDDVTREIVAELTGRRLEYHEEIFQRIKARFDRRGLQLTPPISRQAHVPEGSEVLPNDYGTAPGIYVPGTEALPHLILLPGPPRELRPMFDQYAVPIIRKLAGKNDLTAKVFRTVGLGESYIQEMVGADLAAIEGLELGYCARLGEVDVRLIGSGESVLRGTELMQSRLPHYIVSDEDRGLEEVVVKLLTKGQVTIATAESCTGGLLANRLTNVPGASAVFLEGNVTYSNAAKIRTLGVTADLLNTVGAVSKEAARAMAEGARDRAGANYALSTTGIAGPDGGTPQKPVGTVFVGLAASDTPTEVEQLLFPMDRLSFKQMVTQAALDLLRRRLLGI